VLLEVVLEVDETCPRCAALEPVIRRMCDDLNIPFTVKYMTTRAVAAHEESVAFHTFSPEWVEAFGLPDHKRKLGKIAPILSYIQKTGTQMFPILRVRWHDGIRTKEIVIRGFGEGEEANVFLTNVYTLLKTLKQVVWRR